MFMGAFVRKRTEIQTQSKQNIPNNMTVIKLSKWFMNMHCNKLRHTPSRT